MITLLLGGARSGKSRRAQLLAEAAAPAGVAGACLMIATAEAFDAEMAARIARHQAERGPAWDVIEAPLDLAPALARASGPVVIDCLTLWLSNLMLAGHDVERAGAELAAMLGRIDVPVFLVSNEVGLGLVPETPLGRAFRDAQGRLNQLMARIADRVEFIAAGLPLVLKPA
ncbi:bifunctional adenosylcobinamide kinase/adenosylcobinamide-phosphate guanylyltransferase [Sphingomonas changnyeongensis]|uniref:Bifunctional adenosylcobalamin biosynthesis protein n=1 Tax=Sphingomonas changnyeongensis TaxID=2698679 RepID=A0A7Z2S5W2_9SPHN|nr:bifunctional adenosylcobinamide kinase/adenosylcobinamide-phosphate guanylyltransferase [Sphingomonas changnyeongensis]QHL91560.1 bifunctional adenosylcobinamide kinase/adenosylcobinamide-phosphate guanylyltransferase [Sphingomonas changnyeongensis]